MRQTVNRFFSAMIAVLAIAVMVSGLKPVKAATQRGREWSEFHAPAAATQATISHAAATGKTHIVNCIVATFVAGAAAPTAATLTVSLRDGASGSGTIRFTADMSIAAVAGSSAPPVQLCGLRIPMTAGNAATLEFSASGGANTVEAVYLQGVTE